jgi:hypothetical protein
VFGAGPEALGVRTYLTAAEARQLAADWADLFAEFADRVDDPSRRPPGAVPFEVAVLGRRVPDLAGGRPWAARAGPGRLRCERRWRTGTPRGRKRRIWRPGRARVTGNRVYR